MTAIRYDLYGGEYVSYILVSPEKSVVVLKEHLALFFPNVSINSNYFELLVSEDAELRVVVPDMDNLIVWETQMDGLSIEDILTVMVGFDEHLCLRLMKNEVWDLAFSRVPNPHILNN